MGTISEYFVTNEQIKLLLFDLLFGLDGGLK